MAVGESAFPDIESVAGIRIGYAEAGIKKANRKDLVIFEICEGAQTAGVFTQNAFCAAPVQISKKHLTVASSRYLVINTGNANAGTGSQGYQDAERVCRELATLAGVDEASVLPFSTGVIGEPLPVEKISKALPSALSALSESHWRQAGEGIMTTDTRPKGAFREFSVAGTQYRIAGISKGAGMIRPNMATMLGFVATDVKVEKAFLQSLLADIANKSFNRITIDSDTSTNDSCILVATGQAGNEAVSDLTTELAQTFVANLTSLMQELAHAIVRDGEGATKFVTIEVNQAATSEEATKVAFEVAHSPLVKTALFASDPNWGRILAVVGRAGVSDLDVNGVQIWLNGCEIVRNGGRSPDYTEEKGQAAMAPEEINITIALGRGDKADKVWTTDLSHDYVTINAEYRT